MFSNIKFYIMTLALLYTVPSISAVNTCCDFDEHICASRWTDDASQNITWTWSNGNNLPENPDDTYKEDATNNYWLQNTASIGTPQTAIRKANYNINENDTIKTSLYLDPKATTPDQLYVKITLPTGKDIILFSATETGWYDYSIQCINGVCCTFSDSTPDCSITISIVGTIYDSTNLLAFDDFVINDCFSISTSTTTQV